MSIFKRSQKARAEPQSYTALWLSGNDNLDGSLICPPGYTPLSKNEEVLRCVYKIADLVSNMTIMLMKNGDNGDIRLKNELSKKIDIYPNKYMTRKNFIFRIAADMCIYGNSVVMPNYSGDLLDDLEIWEGGTPSFRKDSLSGNSYRIAYKGRIFDPDEVLHFVLYPDPDEPFRGQGVAPLLKETIDNLAQANATKKSFLRSKWKPSVVISINSDIQELQDPQQRNKILGSYTKTTEAGEPWLIPAGDLKIDTIKPLTLNDLAINDSITLDKKAVAAALDMPAFMVGAGTFSKDEYNNFISSKIMSMATIIQQELTKKLLYSPDMYFKLNPKSLMQYSLQEQFTFVNGMVNSAMLSRNEGRTEFDYSPVDKPGMNEYQTLENYIPIDLLGDQKKLKGGEYNANGSSET